MEQIEKENNFIDNKDPNNIIIDEEMKNICQLTDPMNFRQAHTHNEFFAKNKESLILFQETKHEMFEKLKTSWADTHRRVHDFKLKRLMKFPQVYFLNYQINFDISRRLFENKSNLISKYTFNLENDIELDIGGNLFMRDNLGLGNVFTNFRFYCLGGSLFNNFSLAIGERKNFTYETNYLFHDGTLIDYIYKRKYILSENKHRFSIYKNWDKNTKYNTGFTIINNFENFALTFAAKSYLNSKDQSVEGLFKIGLDEIKISSKFKEKVTDKFFLINSNKFVYDSNFPLFYSHNQLIYKFYNRFFKFGYFYNLDGVGFEIGHRCGGIEINIPIVLFNRKEINFDEEMSKSFLSFSFSFFQRIIIFGILHVGTKIIIKKIKNYFKKKALIKSVKPSEEDYKSMAEIRKYQEKIVTQIKPQAEKNQLLELNKQKYGLIINFAMYGNSKILKKIMNEFHLVEKEKLEDYLDSYITSIENEIVNVTIPIKFMIKRDEKTSISSIFLHQTPKTKIIGFINPCFKLEKEARLLINYTVGSTTFTILKRDSEIFQIPEKLFG